MSFRECTCFILGTYMGQITNKVYTHQIAPTKTVWGVYTFFAKPTMHKNLMPHEHMNTWTLFSLNVEINHIIFQAMREQIKYILMKQLLLGMSAQDKLYLQTISLCVTRGEWAS